MTVKPDVPGAENYVLQEAISAYSDEAYTNAKKITDSGIVGTNKDINPDTETFMGQVRWHKPLNPKINIASLTDPARGETTDSSTDHLRYVKSARTHGYGKVNLQKLVTQIDGLAKVGRDLGETRAQDEHDALLAILRGVAMSEAMYGAASAGGGAGLGGQTFENDPTSKRHGFYVDLGANKLVQAASASSQGAARAEGFLNALGMAFKDYEPEYAYLFASPEIVASLRSANLVDQDRVEDGSITFSSIFNGKLRLVQTRASQGMTAAELAKINGGAGVDIVGTKTSFIVLPGAIAKQALTIDEPTEIQRIAGAYKGGGTTEVWHRWGYVMHPAGYNWRGSEGEFASNATYMGAVEGGTVKAFKDITAADNAHGVWERKAYSALGLGILPVFHS